MKTSFKKLPGSKIDLEVVLTQEEFKPYWDTAREHALANVHLKGFRPGTAPKELAEKAVDSEKVFQDAAHSAVRFSLDEVTKDNNWTLIDAPKIELQETPDVGFKYKAELTIFPQIKLGNYQKIAKKVLAEKKDIKVEPAEITESLEWLRKSRAKDGNAPELNDDFAKSLGPDLKTLADLKNSIQEGLTFEKERKERERLRLKIIEEIVKDAKLEIPEVMVEKTLDNMVKDYERMLKTANPSTGSGQAKPTDDLRNRLREQAKNNVASNLVIYKIAEQEKLQPTKEEVEAGAQSENLDAEKFYDYIYGIILNRKVFQFLEKQHGN